MLSLILSCDLWLFSTDFTVALNFISQDFSDRSLSVLRPSTIALKKISFETTRPNSMNHHSKLRWVTVYKNTTRRHDWPTTGPNSIKLYRKLHCITCYKNTTKHKDLPTTTKWPTSVFALKSIFSEETSLKLLCQIQWNFIGSFCAWHLQRCNKAFWLNNNNKMVDFLVCF